MHNNVSNGFTVNLTNTITMPDVDYINDLARDKNFSLGVSFINPPKVMQDLYYLFTKENDDPETFQVENYLFSREYLEQDVLFRSLNEGEIAYYQNTLAFLNSIEYDMVLGITPMDKVLNVMMHMAHMSKVTNPDENPNANDSYERYRNSKSNPKPKKVKIEDEEQMAAVMKEMANTDFSGDGSDGSVSAQGNSRTSGSQQQQEDHISKNITSCVRDHLSNISPAIANIYGAKKPSDVPINRKILGDIRIKAYLENSHGMGTHLDKKKERNNNSNTKEKRQMENHNQITKINKASMAMDTFDDKFVKKELSVKEKVKPKEKKQILYMLLDDSGSMCCLVKQTYVRAVLLNRLESVVQGKSELVFANYVSSRYNIKHVNDEKTSQEIYREISLRRPGGGGTYIGSVLQETIDEIHDKKDYHDPEIMIVCDGDDHVDASSLDYKGVRINVVILGTTNDGLKKVAEQSGGFFTYEKLYNRY